MIFSRFLQLVLITYLVFGEINPLHCQINTQLTTFPNDTVLLNKIKTTFLILQALNHENRNNIQKANIKWQSIEKSNNKKVKEHQFINRLLLNQRLTGLSPPQTEKSTLAISGYLAWNKKRIAALKALQVDQKTNEILLEEMRLNLLLGHYQQVKKEIALMIPKTKEEKLIQKILHHWYFILTGNIERALEISQTIEVEFLYSPHFILHTSNANFKLEDKLNFYRRSLTRYPSNDILLEYLVKNLEKAEKYCEIKQLLMLQKEIYHLTIPKYFSTVVGRCSDIGDVKIIKDFGYLNWQAEQALKNEHYALLNQYAKALMRFYPEYLDGKLYLAEYYLKTGQRQQYQELLINIQ